MKIEINGNYYEKSTGRECRVLNIVNNIIEVVYEGFKIRQSIPINEFNILFK